MKRIRGSEAKEPNGKCKQLRIAEALVKGPGEREQERLAADT